jgi:hypothetical protein
MDSSFRPEIMAACTWDTSPRAPVKVQHNQTLMQIIYVATKLLHYICNTDWDPKSAHQRCHWTHNMAAYAKYDTLSEVFQTWRPSEMATSPDLYDERDGRNKSSPSSYSEGHQLKFLLTDQLSWQNYRGCLQTLHVFPRTMPLLFPPPTSFQFLFLINHFVIRSYRRVTWVTDSVVKLGKSRPFTVFQPQMSSLVTYVFNETFQQSLALKLWFN